MRHSGGLLQAEHFHASRKLYKSTLPFRLPYISIISVSEMQVTSHTLKLCSVSLQTPLEGFAENVLNNGSEVFG